MEEMKQYMILNDMDNKFIKNLCDDIYISYRTFSTKYGAMYTMARQSSQGTQRCYTVSQTPQDFEMNLMFDENDHKNENDQDQDEDHEVSNFNNTPYLTPSANKVMRSINNPDYKF